MNTSTMRNTTQEFFEVVKHKSSYAGTPSYGYQAGFLQSFIESIADNPKVQAAMHRVLHDHLMELNRECSRLVSK